MKKRLTFVFLGFAVLLAAGPALRASVNDAEELIGRARATILSPHSSRDEITRALVQTLDASLLILPATDYAAEFRSRVGSAKKMFEEGALFEDKIRQYLGLAYKLVTGGEPWGVPEELKPAYRQQDALDLAKKHCLKLLDSALAERKAGRNEQAVRSLIGFVLLVITPMEA
jgi:hypothetical protein